MDFARLISCDEAGFTGPNLLDEDQPLFAYAAIDLTPNEARAIVGDVRKKHRIQSPELKAGLLRRRANWPEIALEIAVQAERRSLITVFDKRLNLGGKAYEYLFEPVLQENSALFYRFNLHRFVMNALHRVMFASGQPVPALARELGAFMRSFDPLDAPSLFHSIPSNDDSSVVLDCVLRFTRGYADKIAERSAHLQLHESDTAKWTLDLTSTALFSLLFRGWGHRYPSIELLCDDSKPLLAIKPIINSWVGRNDTAEISNGKTVSLIRCNLAKPVSFRSSEEYPTIQIADILAGITVDALKYRSDDKYRHLLAWVNRHIHQDHCLPDDDLIDMRAIEPRMNLCVLRELARRADLGKDPLSGMQEFYIGAFKRYRSPASRVRSLIKGSCVDGLCVARKI